MVEEDKCCFDCTYWDNYQKGEEMQEIEVQRITEKEFLAYEAVKQMGYFNMFDGAARELSGLDEKTYREIINNYGVYHKMYIKEEAK